MPFMKRLTFKEKKETREHLCHLCNFSSQALRYLQKGNEYDQIIPESHTSDQPKTQDIRKSIEVKQPTFSSSSMCLQTRKDTKLCITKQGPT